MSIPASYRDEELARFFEDCEWGQEKIAAKMGKGVGIEARGA
jgi:hypothetical protein